MRELHEGNGLHFCDVYWMWQAHLCGIGDDRVVGRSMAQQPLNVGLDLSAQSELGEARVISSCVMLSTTQAN